MLYVEQGMTLADVGKSLKVSPTTLVAWKKDGDWEADRRVFLVEQQSLSELLRQITRRVAEHVRDELNQGICDPQRIHALRSALQGLSIPKERIESREALKREEAERQTESQASPEALRAQIEAILKSEYGVG